MIFANFRSASSRIFVSFSASFPVSFAGGSVLVSKYNAPSGPRTIVFLSRVTRADCGPSLAIVYFLSGWIFRVRFYYVGKTKPILFLKSDTPGGAPPRALVALGDNPCWNESGIILSRSFGEGLLARMTKDEARARTAFEAARAQQEKIVQAQPDYGPALCVLGLIDAALGRKDLALDEGRRAIALMPVEKDVNSGSVVLQYFAITAAWAGDKELALQQLEAGLRAPVASLMLSYGALKLHPLWDPLRGDPRFEKIVSSLAPKE
jgi:tetratricopeptide (TPR) repeat protein